MYGVAAVLREPDTHTTRAGDLHPVLRAGSRPTATGVLPGGAAPLLTTLLAGVDDRNADPTLLRDLLRHRAARAGGRIAARGRDGSRYGDQEATREQQ